MIATATSAFEINLPNAATWFYFSALLAAALFFKFSRILSIRNWDLLSLFLPMPGFLLLDPNLDLQFWGYVWLLAASGYFFCRCLFDLTLVRRPALSPNLTLGGLAWLAAALFASLIAVAVRHPNESSQQRESSPVPMDPMRKLGEKAIMEHTPAVLDQAALEQSLVELWVERGLIVVCHLSIAVGLFFIGWRHFEDLHSGMAAATCYLLLPYTYLLMPRTALGVGRWDQAWPMALMVWTVYFFRRPRVAGFFLGLAAGTVFFPALLYPLWWSFYRRRGARRFSIAFAITACLCLVVMTTILWINDALPRNLFGWKPSAWLPWLQPDADMPSVWVWQGAALHWAYRLPIFLAFVAFVGTTAFWPSPKTLAHVIALSVALLVGIQFWYADRGGIYILWYLPLFLLMVFRPNLTTCQPQPPVEDWISRLGGKLIHQGMRVLRLIHPVARTNSVSRPTP